MSVHYKSLTRRTNPDTIPVFPLSGTVLLPGCDLPLNIFEPRYLNMIDDALKSDRLIGMIRYLIVLKGLKRFRYLEDKTIKTPYKCAKVSFDEFQSDAEMHVGKDVPNALSGGSNGDRAALTIAMKSFAKTLGVKVDWNSLAEIPLANLVDQAAMISPFKPDDKQSLLEAPDTDARRRLLIGLMHLYANTGGDGDSATPPPLQ